MTATQYRLVRPGDRPGEDGRGDVSVRDDAVLLTMAQDDILRVPFGLITATGPAGDFAVRIAMANGTVIELSQLGRLRTQLLAELSDGRAAHAAADTGAVGEPAVFPAQDGDGPAEARVYDDALLIIGTTGTERIGFSFLREIAVTDYVVTLTVLGRPPLALSRLGRRTTEFTDLLSARRAEAQARTVTFLASLLPSLDPDLLRQAAAALRDGVAAPVTALDQISPGLAKTLLAQVTWPERQEAVAELGRRTDLAIGFRQVRSVRQEATGTTPWHDSAITPDSGTHGDPGSFGVLGALGGPGGWWFGGYGGYGGLPGWGFFSGRTEPWHVMTPRADVHRGDLVPATEDLSALNTGGDQATVIAFVLGRTGNRVAFDVISQAGPATWVYRAEGPVGLAAVNRELDNRGFHPGQADDPADPMLAGQAEHGPDWADQLSALLAGTPGAGRPEAGPPEAGTPEAGTPGAGTPGAGTPGAGTAEQDQR